MSNRPSNIAKEEDDPFVKLAEDLMEYAGESESYFLVDVFPWRKSSSDFS